MLENGGGLLHLRVHAGALPDSQAMKDLIRDITLQSFDREVIEASRNVPVLVDFWAQWCAPCRVLGPILEKLALEHKGELVVAKVDIDAEAQLAARFAIRSVPSVKAFRDGTMVAEFSGALPENTVRSFLARLLPTPAGKLRRSAQAAVSEGDFERAEADLRQALELEPELVAARLELIELLLARQAYSEADLEMQRVPEHLRDARAEKLATQIAFWKKSAALPSLQELEARLQQHPGDLEVRIALAERQVAEARYEPALENLLEIVRRDRGALRERARLAMVAAFRLAGEDSELVPRYRRLLSSALY
jgi:putative thioredoxin